MSVNEVMDEKDLVKTKNFSHLGNLWTILKNPNVGYGNLLVQSKKTPIIIMVVFAFLIALLINEVSSSMGLIFGGSGKNSITSVAIGGLFFYLFALLTTSSMYMVSYAFKTEKLKNDFLSMYYVQCFGVTFAFILMVSVILILTLFQFLLLYFGSDIEIISGIHPNKFFMSLPMIIFIVATYASWHSSIMVSRKLTSWKSHISIWLIYGVIALARYLL